MPRLVAFAERSRFFEVFSSSNGSGNAKSSVELERAATRVAGGSVPVAEQVVDSAAHQPPATRVRTS